MRPGAGLGLLPCGAAAAYRRHKRHGETPCEPCRAAYNLECRTRPNRKAVCARYKAANPEATAADRTRWNADNTDYKRNYHLVRKYGVTLEERDALLKLQGDACGLCARKVLDASKWHLDHDHSRSDMFIRGVLCSRCNLVLGRLGDSLDSVQDWASKAVSYLIDNQLRQAIGSTEIAHV